MNVTQPSFAGFFHSVSQHCAEGFANWRHRAAARREERRARAEFDALSPRDLQEIDVTRGNLAWSSEALEGRNGISVGAGGLNSLGALRGNFGN
ncbi:hypothetical protein N825_20075 [Skermanella stibiiresistens SB22]|uniref:DUF1127 domain-containing protein n=2 Tax=Skermanella TaxID=204447 RepID=W9H7X8_9PROT|nr:hypothetical protein N825_20075 [Skermanella stibiiresistens SB22]